MPEIKYVDCNLTILDEERTEYRDDFRSTPICGRIRDEQSGDSLERDTIECLNGWVASDQDLTRDHLELLGRHLYYLLFDDALRDAFEQSYQGFKNLSNKNARLRLVLAFHEKAKELASYPWEFLFMPKRGNEPGFFLCAEKRTELILARFVPESSLEDKLFPEQTSLKILVVFANPRQLGGRLNADKFLEQITSMKRQIEVKAVTENERPEALTKDGLERLIAEFEPHIFHFVGHGDAAKGIALLKTPKEIEEAYTLTGETRDVEWVDSRTLSGLFGDHVPRLVFLHSCEGAAADGVNGFNSTARELVYSHGVPAIVAMQYVISNQSAGLFAQTFYQQIADGKKIDIAVSEGRWALRQSGRGEFADRGFGTPLVYLQNESAIILHQIDEEEAEGPRPEPCPYRDGCRGFVFPTDQICVRCGRPLTICEQGHAMAAELELCPQGHRAAHAAGVARAGASSPAGVHESQIESGRGGVAPETLLPPAAAPEPSPATGLVRRA
jgi:hypothetical protein